MPFLPPNQQRQSTEGAKLYKKLKIDCAIIIYLDLKVTHYLYDVVDVRLDELPRLIQ